MFYSPFYVDATLANGGCGRYGFQTEVDALTYAARLLADPAFLTAIVRAA